MDQVPFQSSDRGNDHGEEWKGSKKIQELVMEDDGCNQFPYFFESQHFLNNIQQDMEVCAQQANPY